MLARGSPHRPLERLNFDEGQVSTHKAYAAGLRYRKTSSSECGQRITEIAAHPNKETEEYSDTEKELGSLKEEHEDDANKLKNSDSRSLVKAEPRQRDPQGSAVDVVATIPATEITWEIVDDTLVKAEPQQCSPRGLATAVVATTPEVSRSSEEHLEPDKTDISNISGNRGQSGEHTAPEPCQHAWIFQSFPRRSTR